MSRVLRDNRRGVVMVWVAAALLALLGMAAVTIDVGRLCIAAQTAQDVADAAALGGGSALPDYAAAQTIALDLGAASNETASGVQVSCSSAHDIQFWGPGETVPDFGLLGNVAWGMEVSGHVPVQYTFARVFDLEGATVSRSCIVVRMPVGGVPIAPMWINYQTDYQYGQQQELLMADGPHYENIPGSFGWLEPPSGDQTEFLELLRGYNLTPEQIATNYASIDDVLYAKTGLAVGQWRKALEQSSDGLARMERAMWEPWTYDTFDDFHHSNPRLVIIPMCEYLGDTGSGAQFQVHAFGAFWLESVNAKKKPYSITGRFIDYTMPGAGGDPLAPETGLWTVQMVK